MSGASLRTRIGWRRVRVIFVVILVLSVWGLCYWSLTHPRIESVSIDESSEWNRYFLSKSGFSTIRVRSSVASRRYIDDISVVGSNRPVLWFEELGFEDVEELEMIVRTITRSLPDDGSSQRVLVMQHPMIRHKTFYYLPRAGILICQYP